MTASASSASMELAIPAPVSNITATNSSGSGCSRKSSVGRTTCDRCGKNVYVAFPAFTDHNKDGVHQPAPAACMLTNARLLGGFAQAFLGNAALSSKISLRASPLLGCDGMMSPNGSRFAVALRVHGDAPRPELSILFPCEKSQTRSEGTSHRIFGLAGPFRCLCIVRRTRQK